MATIMAVRYWDEGPVERANLITMARAATYEEAGEATVWTDPGIGLGDGCTSSESGYAVLNSRDGLYIVADARIDNREEMAAALDITLTTLQDDRRLILAAYRRWGRQCAARLIGDFAFIIWDSRAKALFAARDVMGARPLHYARTGKYLALATEARQLLVLPGVSRTPARAGIWMWLHNEYDERVTMFDGVSGLGPGECLWAEDGHSRIETFWHFESVKTLRYKHVEEYVAHFRELFLRSVSDRCRTPGPVIGCMLSGGMDSTSVAAAARRATRNRGVVLRPFSFRFKRLKDCDETLFSRAVAQMLNLDITWIDCEEHWFLKGLFQDTIKRENPYYCWDLMDHAILKELGNSSGKVLLTGHGGDSLMTGVGRAGLLGADFWRGHRRALPKLIGLLKSRKRSVLRGLFRHLLASELPPRLRYGLRRLVGRLPAPPPWIAPTACREFHRTGRLFQEKKRVYRRADRQLAYTLIAPRSSGMARVTHWYQRVARRYGIEVCHPFLDRRLAEFMLAIPQDIARLDNLPKGLLRRAMKGWLPESVLNRDDKPDFASFYHYGIQNEINAINELMQGSILAEMGFIDKDAFMDSVIYYSSLDPAKTEADFWTVLLTETWLKKELQ